MAIRVVVADDQALVRGSFRVLVDLAPGLYAPGLYAAVPLGLAAVRTRRQDV
ncbi:hypothetical protein ACIQVO_17520 [Streptomyces sp. NPDC101062]|uniref:hypothetical protein n=1 Tax=unclassified Streptomyces TaxID=2593676 RepID=UPI00380B33BB